MATFYCPFLMVNGCRSGPVTGPLTIFGKTLDSTVQKKVKSISLETPSSPNYSKLLHLSVKNYMFYQLIFPLKREILEK